MSNMIPTHSSITDKSISISDSSEGRSSPGRKKKGRKKRYNSSDSGSGSGSSNSSSSSSSDSVDIVEKIEAALMQKQTSLNEERKKPQPPRGEGGQPNAESENGAVAQKKVIEINVKSLDRRVVSPRHRKSISNPFERDLRIRPPEKKLSSLSTRKLLEIKQNKSRQAEEQEKRRRRNESRRNLQQMQLKDKQKAMLKKDSRFRFRYLESHKSESESELEEEADICVMLLQNVSYPKPRKKVSFADFYSTLNECRRNARSVKGATADTEERKKPVKSTQLSANVISFETNAQPTQSQKAAGGGVLKSPSIMLPDVQGGATNAEDPGSPSKKKTVKFQLEAIDEEGAKEQPQADAQKAEGVASGDLASETKPGQKKLSQLDISGGGGQNLKRQPTRLKSEVAIGVPDQTDLSDKGSEDSQDEVPQGKKLDYSLPVTASEIFRANFIVNKTLKKKKNVKQWIPSSHEFWFALKNKLSMLISGLSSTMFSENIADAREAGDFFRTAVEQFPLFGDGFRASIHLHLYMASLNLKIYQFQQSSDFIKAASTLLKERVTKEEEDQNAKHRNYNLRTYAQILMLKGDRCTKMHDHELAYRSLYKAQRALMAMDPQENNLWARWYELMAAANITAKELMQAFEYTTKARALHLQIGLIEHDRLVKKQEQAALSIKKTAETLEAQKTKLHFQKKRAQAPVGPPKNLISPFVADPIHSRLMMIEMMTFMSDYRSAYHLAHPLFLDIKFADRNRMLALSLKDTVKFLSVILYLQEKLKMYPAMIDLYESYICNEEVMTKCNPFSMYYILEFARFNPKLKDIHRYQSDQMSQLSARYLKLRFEVRKKFLANPCFTVFEGISPAQAADNEWVEIVGYFTEALADHLIFLRAIQVETQKGFKEYFSSRMIVLRTPLEDRLQLIFEKDMDETTNLRDFWPV